MHKHMLSSRARSFMMLFQTVEIPRSKRVRDEQTVEEYREDDVQDSVYISVLKQTYEMFKVLIYTLALLLLSIISEPNQSISRQ